MMGKIRTFFKENGSVIASIGGTLMILNSTGFSINIPKFYNALDIEGKIVFMALINFVITIIAMSYVLMKIGSK